MMQGDWQFTCSSCSFGGTSPLFHSSTLSDTVVLSRSIVGGCAMSIDTLVQKYGARHIGFCLAAFRDRTGPHAHSHRHHLLDV